MGEVILGSTRFRVQAADKIPAFYTICLGRSGGADVLSYFSKVLNIHFADGPLVSRPICNHRVSAKNPTKFLHKKSPTGGLLHFSFHRSGRRKIISKNIQCIFNVLRKIMTLSASIGGLRVYAS
jgi:hypothetical protein